MVVVKFFLLCLVLFGILFSEYVALKNVGDSCSTFISNIQSGTKIIGKCEYKKDCAEYHSSKFEYCRKNRNIICCPIKLRPSEKYGFVAADVIKSFDSRKPQIVGGEKAKLGEFPHMISIGYISDTGKYESFCGSSLISDRYVLTAAHCFATGSAANIDIDLSDVVLRSNVVNLDDSNAQNFGIEKLVIHQKYKNKYNDIALIKLNETVNFSTNIRPACLWQSNISLPIVSTIGYGRTNYSDETSKSRDLLKVVLRLQDDETCKKAYIQYKRDLPIGLTDNHGCAGVPEGGKDACIGDSGGPLHYERPADRETNCIYVGGVVAFGKDCALADKPGVFTKVYPYLDWIESIVWPENKVFA